MGSYRDTFPSKYLSAADLKGREPILTIERVDVALIGEDRKLVVKFVNVQKLLVLNKTNATMIASIAGSDDTDYWGNIQVRLFKATVQYQGRFMDGLRLDAAPRVPQAAQQRQPTPPPPARQATSWGPSRAAGGYGPLPSQTRNAPSDFTRVGDMSRPFAPAPGYDAPPEGFDPDPAHAEDVDAFAAHDAQSIAAGQAQDAFSDAGPVKAPNDDDIPF